MAEFIDVQAGDRVRLTHENGDVLEVLVFLAGSDFIETQHNLRL